MSLPLITKYRPVDFDEIYGNQEAIASLREVVSSDDRQHSYLFTGPTGVGKTTLARIIANKVDASILEIDGASHSGVDDVRGLVDMAIFQPITTQKNRMYIIDECHALSKQAWQALLKLLEDPPPYLFISLCTTETSKVPETIKTRCHPCALKAVSINDISRLLEDVCSIEGWTVVDDVFNAIVVAASGSPRRALGILQAGHSVATRDELSKIIIGVDVESSAIVVLCKYLMTGGRDWKQIQVQLAELADDEEAIYQAIRYLSSSAMRTEKEEVAKRYWDLLEAFLASNGLELRSRVMSAVGKILWWK
jgi:DNA polymerase III gamma/tau subunit